MNDSIKQASLAIVENFINALISKLEPASILHLELSNFLVFAIAENNCTQVNNLKDILLESKYDFIAGDFAFSNECVDFDFGERKVKLKRNWYELIYSLQFLENDGTALFLLEPTVFSSTQSSNLKNVLNSRGYFVSAIFNAPDSILQPETSISPIFTLITKEPSESTFVAELLDKKQSAEVIESYRSNLDWYDLKKGMQIPANSFYSFHKIKIKHQIEKLETQYKNFNKYTIEELSTEINYVRHNETLQEKNNSIYIPDIKKFPVANKLSDLKLSDDHYFQVVLNDLAINEYLSFFFSSTLGELILDGIASGIAFHHIKKHDIEQALIALPSIEEQRTIVETQKKLQTLKTAIDEFDTELALKPISSNQIVNQLDLMLNAIDRLNHLDKIRGLIREGESKSIEFKESLSLDLKTGKKAKYIQEASLKTVAAFLNTDGGTLLVGIADDGNISGVNEELNKFHQDKNDKFLLHWKNLLKEHIGEHYYPFLDYRTVEINERKILFVVCKKSPYPCYLNNEFYVRTNPATDKLEGHKLVEYVRNHFKSV